MALTIPDAMFGARYHAAINQRFMVLKSTNTLIQMTFLGKAAFLSMVFEAKNCEGLC